MELQPCSPVLWTALLGPHLLLQKSAASPRGVFHLCAAVFDSCPSLHLTAIFSWAQLQVPRSGVLLMLCSPGLPDHTQQGTEGALPGCLHHRACAQPDQIPPLPGPRLISQPRYSNFKDLIMISPSSTWHWYNPAPFNGTWLLLAFSVLINNQGKQHQHQVFNHWNLSLVSRALFSTYYSGHCVPLINSALRTDFRGSAAQGAQDVICTVLIKCCLCGCNFYQWYGREIANTWNCIAGLLLVQLHRPWITLHPLYQIPFSAAEKAQTRSLTQQNLLLVSFLLLGQFWGLTSW